MEALQQLYEQFLKANQTFELQPFTVPFHALAGTLGWAMQLQQLEPKGEMNRLLEVKGRAEEQINLRSPENSSSSQAFTDSRSRLSFYRTIKQVINNQRALSSCGKVLPSRSSAAWNCGTEDHNPVTCGAETVF